jgi:hypothetical protein
MPEIDNDLADRRQAGHGVMGCIGRSLPDGEEVASNLAGPDLRGA